MTDKKTTLPLSMLDHALALAEKGFAVFPANPSNKKSLIKAWQENATKDPDQIRQWWVRWPRALIGAPTGWGCDLWVLDLDAKVDDVTGEVIEVADLIAIVEEAIGEPLPQTLATATPRGGRHLFYRMPSDGREVRNRNPLMENIDVRGEGGYVIVPPSIRADSAVYRWADEVDPVEAPEALLDLVIKPVEQAEEEGGAAPAVKGDFQSTLAEEDEAVRKYALAAVDGECHAVRTCGKGGRNNQLNKAAFSIGQLVGAQVITRAMAFGLLQDAAQSNGLMKDDGAKAVQATINSGLNDGANHPRDLSEIRAKAARRASRSSFYPPAPSPEDYGGFAEGSSKGNHPENQEDQGDNAEKAEKGNQAGEGGDKRKKKRKKKSSFAVPPRSALYSALDRELAELERNDLGNGERLQARFGQDLLYVRDIGWHHWCGSHWTEDDAWEYVHKRAHETARAMQDEATALRHEPPDWLQDEDEIAEFANSHFGFAISCGNAGRIANMIATAQNYMTIEPSEMDADLMVINLENGTMKLEGACETLKPHRREDRLAKVMPVSYDPDASYELFQRFMDTAIPCKKKQAFLQVWAGLCLTGLTREQKFVFNFGEGGNGKSVFMDLLAKMMGPYAATINFSTLLKDERKRGSEATPDLARLPGKRLVKASEPERGSVLAEAVIKEITGGEPLQVRKLREDFFEFFPQFKLMVSGNHRPSIRSADRGIWRRVVLFHWDQNIPEDQQDKGLPDKLWQERSGILNWLLDGVRRYLEDGLQVPDVITKETNDYKEDSDPLGRFIADCIERAPGEEVNATTLYEAYCSWARLNEAPIYKATGFGRAMVERGLEKRKKRTVSYLNIRLDYVMPDAGGVHDGPPVPPVPQSVEDYNG
ncbi:hypothetical protein FDK21_19310 [Cohaesibacter sp. CAU 1516]|uniref:phage/plasmid primase, P4 family n=1 Tax=Cohaesibacter sp. CAU 1516 TaxID=2576038 RepID=UPI0010FE2B0F|nr:phage/plasmid primase, P4 family [Cohaesibacter sp. CAU 1516]TLP42663.1 hypothetical protein FDK21_19310 [Cohaesibacter sp. CAU 1516]